MVLNWLGKYYKYVRTRTGHVILMLINVQFLKKKNEWKNFVIRSSRTLLNCHFSPSTSVANNFFQKLAPLISPINAAIWLNNFMQSLYSLKEFLPDPKELRRYSFDWQLTKSDSWRGYLSLLSCVSKLKVSKNCLISYLASSF